MSPWFLDTLRQGIRHPGPWMLVVLGLGLGLGGLGLAILALDDRSQQAPALVQSTALLAGALTALWVSARLLEMDTSSSFGLAADATAPGPAGRALGRWGGAAVLGVAVYGLVDLSLRLLAGIPLGAAAAELRLHGASILALGLMAAWGVLLTGLLRGAGALLVGSLLWGLAHLPWGTPELLAGRAGAAVGTLLPGPRPPSDLLRALPATAAAIAAVLLVALAVGGRARLRR